MCLCIFTWLYHFLAGKTGDTPLLAASMNGHLEVCKALIAAKASVDAATKVSRLCCCINKVKVKRTVCFTCGSSGQDTLLHR